MAASKKMTRATRERLAKATGTRLSLSQRAVEIRRKFVGRMMSAGAKRLALDYLLGKLTGAEVARALYNAAAKERSDGRHEAADAAESLAQIASLLDGAHKNERGSGCSLSLARKKIREQGGQVAKLGLKLNPPGMFAVTYLVGSRADMLPALTREPAFDTVAHVRSVVRRYGIRAELRGEDGALVASMSSDGRMTPASAN